MVSELFSFNSTTVILVVICTVFWMSVRRRKRLPPGPIGYPLIGNITQVNVKDGINEFQRLRKEYGDVFCFKIMQKTNIVVNGNEAITDLLVKHADSLSVRPDSFFLTIFNNGLGKDLFLYFLKYLSNKSFPRENRRDLTQSYDKSPLYHRKILKKVTTQKTPPKTSITQRLLTDLGRSVGGYDSHPTGVIKPVYGIQTFPSKYQCILFDITPQSMMFLSN